MRDVSPNSPPFNSADMRRPIDVPVASRMRMRATSGEAWDRSAMYDGKYMSNPKTIGPNTVAIANHLVRTRSMYSRCTTTKSFRMDGRSVRVDVREEVLRTAIARVGCGDYARRREFQTKRSGSIYFLNFIIYVYFFHIHFF